ncbi:calmodulin [Murinocardiopsis flavida]|uniref:Calmodulin n=1 Tax=Murinocardiopsis flavida TaxID=645275 RepID=A0A2P8D8T7_9ACTN|nr:EF-hand domain-containing protein [Murinocardiopsis flavida]PSK93607.1 calmodulin [Murinocardiopsis flavida]
MADVNDYAATFDLVDSDDDGRISAAELRELMSALGNEISAERADEAVSAADSDGDGRISLEEFAWFMRENS